MTSPSAATVLCTSSRSPAHMAVLAALLLLLAARDQHARRRRRPMATPSASTTTRSTRRRRRPCCSARPGRLLCRRHTDTGGAARRAEEQDDDEEEPPRVPWRRRGHGHRHRRRWRDGLLRADAVRRRDVVRGSSIAPSLSHGMERQKIQMVPIMLIIPIATGVVVAIVILVLILRRRGKQPVQMGHVVDGMQGKKLYDQEDERLAMEDEDMDGEITSCQSYSYQVLEAATCHFSNRNKLGSGGFGTVYKGTLENGKEVAVKKLRDSKRNQQELEREIYMVANLCHKNLVRFLGYCLEDEGKFLVYEYVLNNSLEKFWYKACFHSQKLEWAAWFNIIKGVARGLRFLHDKWIIHIDLKPHNVILDENFNPNTSDFDLTRM